MTCECWSFDSVDYQSGQSVYRCNGTKDREWCFCGGDKSKCDFYENVKNEVKNEKQQIIKEKEEENEIFNEVKNLLNNKQVERIDLTISKDYVEIIIEKKRSL